MNKKIATPLIVGLGLIMVLFVVIQMLTSGRNALGEFYKYLLPMAFFLGFAAPKLSLYVLAILAIYVDLGKKLLVVGENLFFTDLFFVLGTPSVLLLGACLSRSLRLFFNWNSPEVMLERKSFLLSIGVMFALSILVLARAGLSVESGKDLAVSVAYFGLLFLVPSVLRSRSEVFSYLRFLFIIMVPAAGYAIYHFLHGMNDFELTYYASGFSRNDIYVFNGEGVFGPFASQGALSSAMMAAAVLTVSAMVLSKSERRKLVGTPLALILILLFVTAAVMSLKRGPLLILPMSLALYFILRNRAGYVVMVFGGVASLAGLVFYGDWVAQQLPEWQRWLNSALSLTGDAEKNLFRIRTLNVRMVEFSSLADSRNWVPFGLLFGQGNEAYGYTLHAGVVSLVYRLGYIPLLVLAAVAVPLSWYLHGMYLEVYRDGKRLAAYCFCLGLALIIVPMLGFGVWRTFPVPYFLGLSFSIFWLLRYLPLNSPEALSVSEQEANEAILSKSYAQ
ncbi:hypothetical protein [Roseibacillus ishigakijimensis]|uniref:O-Antigen ligase n=1 Tax=Roseibacillus ishigakijimensis TaxID=454146 RepID=A0A934RM94_9BACT|nr:hypothetical protein [Roseibacillus ishigakijimensis]MBK1833423.1 hypothetical protein [Roseibacillus ishigakijimensis]